jgi:protein TonB
MGPNNQRPQIVGGRGSFYLSIEYPEEARRQGIQGRVILDFVVDVDGRTQDIRVLKSLHPLCDSSAVAALERTRFIPGQRDGEKIPVRMRLPVRFQLVNLTAEQESTRAPSPPTDAHQ